jgi:hypothetical protein
VFVECSTAGRNDAGAVVGTLVSLSCVRVHVFGAAAVRWRCGGGAVGAGNNLCTVCNLLLKRRCVASTEFHRPFTSHMCDTKY